MKGLLIKDFYLLKNQKYFFFIIVIMCIGTLFVNFNPVFVISYSTFMVTISTISSINYDEFDKGYSFLFTLPISRKSYVTEKYVFGFLIGGGTWVLVTSIILLVETAKHQTAGVEILTTGFLVFLMALMFLALALPVQLKFGAEKGRIAFLAIFGVVFLIVFCVVKGMGKVLIPLLTMKPMDFIGILMVICILVFGISYPIAVKIMKKKQF